LGLDKEQKLASEYVAGPACIIAGAGTGKTTTLVGRVRFLIEEREIEPNKILVTTFTRKATAELFLRIGTALSDKATGLNISTIDSLAWDIYQSAARLSLVPERRLLGEAEQKIALLEARKMTFRGVSGGAWWSDPNSQLTNFLVRVLGLYDEKKGLDTSSLIFKEAFNRLTEEGFYFIDGERDYYTKKDLVNGFNKILEQYYQTLQNLSAIDYDTLKKKVPEVLKKNIAFTKTIADSFEQILIDEFQDTSEDQIDLLLQISKKNKNVWAVGDPCQQIYEWRGALSDNFIRFQKRTKAKTFHLTSNRRSSQKILDTSYAFLNSTCPNLKRKGLLKKLISTKNNLASHPIYSSDAEKSFLLMRSLLDQGVSPSEIAILSRQLDKRTVNSLKELSKKYKVPLQFHSYRADKAMEQTLGYAPHWKSGNVLRNLYSHKTVNSKIRQALNQKNFEDIKIIRPLAVAADALDSTVHFNKMSFQEAWSVVERIQDREVHVSSSVAHNSASIQVMTIHASKGLEFPVVFMMKIGAGEAKSFPRLHEPEDCRVSYVAMTRAEQLLILVHGKQRPAYKMSHFGSGVVSLRKNEIQNIKIQRDANKISGKSQIISGTNLDLFQLCPLLFGAFHEGRYLPQWTKSRSMGSRLHKAIEHFLRRGMPSSTKEQRKCFEDGLREGDSPTRLIPKREIGFLEKKFQVLAKSLRAEYVQVISVEQRYRFSTTSGAIVEGVVDAVLKAKNGDIHLQEWKTSSTLNDTSFSFQVFSNLIGQSNKQNAPSLVKITSILDPKISRSFSVSAETIQIGRAKIDDAVEKINQRSFSPQKGKHCENCDLKTNCSYFGKKAKTA